MNLPAETQACALQHLAAQAQGAEALQQDVRSTRHIIFSWAVAVQMLGMHGMVVANYAMDPTVLLRRLA